MTLVERNCKMKNISDLNFEMCTCKACRPTLCWRHRFQQRNIRCSWRASLCAERRNSPWWAWCCRTLAGISMYQSVILENHKFGTFTHLQNCRRLLKRVKKSSSCKEKEKFEKALLSKSAFPPVWCFRRSWGAALRDPQFWSPPS